MSALAYLWGVLAVAATTAALVAAAAAVARTVLPDWRGAVQVLGCVAVILCWVFAVSYVLGAMGAFRPLPLLVVVNAGPLVVLWRARRSVPVATAGAAPAPPGALSRQRDPAFVVAAIAVVIAVSAWLPGVAHAYRYGIFEPDSTWYHGHFVTRFVQTGWLTRLNPVGTDSFVPYHPVNSEMLDALLVLPWHRDIALPLVGLCWLGLLLLAGWCLGGKWNRGPAGLVVTALLAAPAVVRLSQPGSLKNDLLAIALLVTGVALLVHSERRPAGLFLAGAMLGLSVGTRTNLLAPVAVIVAFGVVALVVPARREHWPRAWWAPLAAWAGGVVMFGTYWYLRNWVRAGNPLPWLELDAGPLHLRRAGADHISDTTIAHWRHDPDLVGRALRPGAWLAFGELWWGWGLLALASVGLVVARRRSVLWAMVAAGAAGLVTYLVTPLTLVVPPDAPMAPANVAVNTRYALPALGLILLAGAAATRSRRAELAFAVVTLVLVVSAVRTPLSRDINNDGEAADGRVALILGVGLVVAVLGAMAVWPRVRDRPVRARLLWGLVPPILAAAVAFPLVDRYLDRRYGTSVPAYAAELWPDARHLRDARIGIATAAVPYPLFGADLSNHVDYIGVTQPRGLLRNVDSCGEWMAQIRRHDFTYIALSPDPFGTPSVATARTWTLAIPGAHVVEDRGDATLIALPRDLGGATAGACRRAGPGEIRTATSRSPRARTAPKAPPAGRALDPLDP